MRFQWSEQPLVGERLETEQLQDVCFVEIRSLDLPLPVEGGQGEELQQEDALRRGALQGGPEKLAWRGMPSCHLGEERVRGEEEIDTQRAAISRAEPFVFLLQNKSGEMGKILDREDQVDVAGVSPIDILEEGEPTDEDVRDAVMLKSREKTFGLGKESLFVHLGSILKKQGVAQNRRKIVAPTQRGSGRWCQGGRHS